MKISSARSTKEKLALSGAALLMVGLFTGFWVAAAFSGAAPVKVPHMALAAHMNALLGGFWLLSVAFSVEFLRYDEKKLRILSYLVILPAWANWFVTLIKSALGVDGLGYNTDFANNVIAGSLQAFVVLPAILGGMMWVWGFLRKPADQA